MSARGENVDCSKASEDDGTGDIADAGADDGGSIPRDGRGRAGEGREIEGEDVEDREGHLVELSPRIEIPGGIWQDGGFRGGEPVLCEWNKPAMVATSLHTERKAAVLADSGAGEFASPIGMSR